jgi:hypothetical protein
MKTRTMSLGALIAGGLLALGPGISAADGASATAKAAQHAGLAAGAGDAAMVQRHLHHTLNCLVGAGGEGFDEAAGNPCGQDGGAIPQTADAAHKEMLEKVAMQVKAAIGNSDVEAAKKAATEAQMMLSH